MFEGLYRILNVTNSRTLIVPQPPQKGMSEILETLSQTDLDKPVSTSLIRLSRLIAYLKTLLETVLL